MNKCSQVNSPHFFIIVINELISGFFHTLFTIGANKLVHIRMLLLMLFFLAVRLCMISSPSITCFTFWSETFPKRKVAQDKTPFALSVT